MQFKQRKLNEFPIRRIEERAVSRMNKYAVRQRASRAGQRIVENLNSGMHRCMRKHVASGMYGAI